jgi:hypothetical protein
MNDVGHQVLVAAGGVFHSAQARLPLGFIAVLCLGLKDKTQNYLLRTVLCLTLGRTNGRFDYFPLSEEKQ